MSIERGNFGNDEELNQEPLDGAEGIKAEAENLHRKQREKTFGERVFSAYQTRESKLKGSEIERGEAFRFERGQIYKGYINLRNEIRRAAKAGEDTTSKRELLKEMRERAKVIEKDLDELNRQFYENARDVEVETEYGKFTVPVVELDLKRYKEGDNYRPEEDTRIPEVYLNGAVSNWHQNASYLMARALQGHRIIGQMTLEQPSVQKPEGFLEVLNKKGNLEPYAEVVKKLISKMGLEQFDLSGWSMGATVALEVAQDPDLKGLNNLTIMEPLGIQNKGFLRLGVEFGLIQHAYKTMMSSETKIKALRQGMKDSQAGFPALVKAGMTLSKKHFTPETLSAINPKGHFQIWMGTKSPLVDKNIVRKVFGATEELRREQHPDASPLELYRVESDHGFPMVNSLGLSKMIDGQKPKSQLTTIKEEDLGNSAMEWVLKDIKSE